MADNDRRPTTAPVESATAAAPLPSCPNNSDGYLLIMPGGQQPGLTREAYAWLIFDDNSSTGFDMCSTTKRILVVDYQGFQVTKPLYPESLPPFDVGSHGSCTYNGKYTNEAGSLTCADGKEFKCLEYNDRGDGTKCKSGDGGYKMVYPKLRCQYS